MHAQPDFELPIAPRVDTTDAEVKKVYELWKSHLSDQPEKIYNNPHWSESQKQKWHDYDISRRWTYGYELSNGMNFHDTFQMKPRVLSIEARDSMYVIRTLHAPDELSNSNEIYSLQRVYAGKENGEWKLFSPLPFLTQNWNRQVIGEIEYFFPKTHDFDESQAKSSSAFVEELYHTYGLSNQEKIEYYLASNYDQMAKISGLDYAWDGNDGRGYPRNNQVFVGTGSESYPHELVHVVFNDYELHPLISEGLATYYGGIGPVGYEKLLESLKKAVKEKDLTFEAVLSGQRISAQTYYTGGALIIESTLDEGGIPAVKRLLKLSENKDGIYAALNKIFGIKKEEADQWWKNQLLP